MYGRDTLSRVSTVGRGNGTSVRVVRSVPRGFRGLEVPPEREDVPGHRVVRGTLVRTVQVVRTAERGREDGPGRQDVEDLVGCFYL